MKALRLSTFTENLQNLTLERLPDPPLRPGEVKIKIHAARLNPSDDKKAAISPASSPIGSSGKAVFTMATAN
jgi:NADPH:quinone reductase-like Zn-dependent oxidoreductase